MKNALIAASVYFIALFALGFGLGTLRVLLVTPLVGPLAATSLELLIMLAAAYALCRRVIARWQVTGSTTLRAAMALWFLILLFAGEALLGAALFGRSPAQQWRAALGTPAGLLGLLAQIIVAGLPLGVGRQARR
ncbi:hypothetical protein [Polymorphobacter sp.]|uniref:hypothetical protein n=1 Tax=Polymorphobacter sp. TaxID=1909290 RepID=UPI003F717ACC